MTDSTILTKVCVALFVTTRLLHAGLALAVAQVRSPLRSPWLVVGALIGNFVLVPAVALLIARLFHLNDGLSLGLLLVGMSAALLVATHVAQDPDAAVMVIVVILVGEAILFSSATAVGRWSGGVPRQA